MRRLAAVVLLLLACSKKPSTGGLEVHVVVKAQVKADCVGLWVRAGGDEKMTDLVTRKPELVFAVAEGGGISGEVRLEARAFLGDCSGAPTLNASSASHVEAFRAGEVRQVTVTIDGALDDDDGDGFRSRETGGVDCDDSSPLAAPGLAEQCGDGLDNDCSGAADCADTKCDGVACDDGRACTASDRCMAGQCRGDTACPAPNDCTQSFGCAADGGCDLRVVPGGFCDGGQCRETAECIPAGREWSCTNGIDDDGDQLTDCADDADCNMARCSDGLACTTGDVCMPDVGCQGVIACNAPPGRCWSEMGACLLDGGCEYFLAVGAACDDGVSCTHSDVCLDDGGCSGRTYACSGPTSCFGGGTCEGDGGCTGPALTGTACDDTDPCTFGDLCAAGVCLGMPYSCVDRDCEVAFCAGDGGCGYAPKLEGTTCDGTGRCDAVGVCVKPLWPFAPANFAPSAIPDGGYSDVVFFDAGCDAVFDSTDGGFTGWCGSRPTPVLARQDGGPDLMLLPMQGLVMSVGSRLRLVGARPVALAIAGDAWLAGTVLATSDGTTLGAGANWAGCGPSVGGSGGVDGPSMRGGGGGGGSFATRGSNGAGVSAAVAGVGGALNANAVRPLRGGCPGGNGGAATAANGGRGGNGGGALQISVTGRMDVLGIVSASGAGGRPGLSGLAGGGGGGSGGGLLLEAGQLGLHDGAALTCNGGGGGEGSGTGIPGLPGANGSVDSGVPAAGGAGGTSGGGDGANGASANADAGTVMQPFCVNVAGDMEGCGAGGGGLGRLRLEGHFACGIQTPTISAVTVTVCP